MVYQVEVYLTEKMSERVGKDKELYFCNSSDIFERGDCCEVTGNKLPGGALGKVVSVCKEEYQGTLQVGKPNQSEWCNADAKSRVYVNKAHLDWGRCFIASFYPWQVLMFYPEIGKLHFYDYPEDLNLYFEETKK